MKTIFKFALKKLIDGLAPAVPCLWSVPRRRNRIAITFDDGPSSTTPAVLDILKSSGTKATFFVLGNRIGNHPDIVHRIIAEGHEVAIHGYDHTLTRYSRQVSRCVGNLSMVGIKPRLIRPPGGRLSGAVLWLWWRGYRTILFNFDTHDSMRHEGKWTGAPPDYEAVRGGDIVLMHDDNPMCIAELPVLVRMLQEKGLEAVTVSGLLQR